MKARIKSLISALSVQMYEREQVIAFSLLAGIAGSNTFLYGAPGTAKSLISRRVASAFEFDAYFEYLMNRFSTPEEIFGPVSIKALKQDQYLRKTEHYLPRADVAFLDEIWKASPAILNTLLTLLNEKTFKNGDMIQQVPLKVLMSASNEVPEANQGLDALYDRFILRLMVKPIAQQQHFHALLQAQPSATKLKIATELKISENELLQWRQDIYQIELPQHILHIFDLIKQKLHDHFDEFGIYVSDRRWQRMAYLVKCSAFLNERQQVSLSDLFILKHCLWGQIEDIAFVTACVHDSITEIGLDHDLRLEQHIQHKEQLEKDILNTFYYTEDVYESYLIAGKEYVRAVTNLDHHYKDKVLYLELDKMDRNKDFFAVDISGEEIRGIVCNFNATRQCTLKGGYYGLEEVVTPYIKYPKGTQRSQVSAQIKYDLLQDVQTIDQQLQYEKQQLQGRFQQEQQQGLSIFVAQDEQDLLFDHLQHKLDRYQIQIQDSARLQQLCKA